MATSESGITAALAPTGADATAPPASSASTAADSSSASQGTSSTPDTASPVTTDVQGASGTTTDSDPLAGVPSIDELNQLPDTTQYKKSLVQLRSAYEPLKTQFDELQQKFSPFQPLLERFEQPAQLQSTLELQDNLFAWETDAQTGQPIPYTQKFAEAIDQQHPAHANDLVATLLEMPTLDAVTGQTLPRWEIVLHGIAEDPTERATALRILGGVEPNNIAPQWQPTEDELAVVKPELQDVYRKLPYEDRVELKENSPEFINKTLQQLKLTQDLQADRERYQQQEQQRQQQREQYVNQQASQAGDEYVNTHLSQTLSTFAENAVQQCQFVKPIDPSNVPQGMTAEQVVQYNQQAAQINAAEAVTSIASIIALFNPQTKEYIVPYLKQIGAVDDKMLGQLEAAGSSFGNNGRNFGNLTFRQKLTANGNYQPDAGTTQLSNEAQRALKTMAAYANQIFGKLIERKSQAFELRAQQHNNTLNGSGAVRPPINGAGYNPTTASASANQPTGWLSREEMARQYG